MLPGRHVRIGEVQRGEGGRTGRQQGELVAAHREEVPLDARAPDGGREPHRGERSRRTERALRAGHRPHFLAWYCTEIAALRFTTVPAAGSVPVTVPSSLAVSVAVHAVVT